MHQLIVKVTFDDGDQARVWRVGNTVCLTFYATLGGLLSSGWTAVERHGLTKQERSLDLVEIAREIYKGDTFTLMSV